MGISISALDISISTLDISISALVISISALDISVAALDICPERSTVDISYTAFRLDICTQVSVEIYSHWI